MDVLDALDSRFSCRAFLPDPVPLETVRAILAAAARAPSGGNLQPWHVYALAGPALARLVADVEGRMRDLPRGEVPEYRVYPQDLKDPLRGAALPGRRGALCGARRDARGQGRPRPPVPPQFPPFRRTGRPLHLSRPDDGAAAMGRLRHVPAKRHARRPAPTGCTPAPRKPGRSGTGWSANISLRRRNTCFFAPSLWDTPI